MVQHAMDCICVWPAGKVKQAGEVGQSDGLLGSSQTPARLQVCTASVAGVGVYQNLLEKQQVSKTQLMFLAFTRNSSKCHNFRNMTGAFKFGTPKPNLATQINKQTYMFACRSDFLSCCIEHNGIKQNFKSKAQAKRPTPRIELGTCPKLACEASPKGQSYP